MIEQINNIFIIIYYKLCTQVVWHRCKLCGALARLRVCAVHNGFFTIFFFNVP